MYSDHAIEKEIRFNLRKSKIRNPPKEFLTSFEDQVWSKITNPRPQEPGQFIPGLAILLLLTLLVGYALLLLRIPTLPSVSTLETAPLTLTANSALTDEIKTEEENQKSDSVPQPMSEHIASESIPMISDEELDRHIRDFLILELLGEADGLLENFNALPGTAETVFPTAM